MGAQDWMKQAIDEFFDHHKDPTQQECDQKAHALLRAKAVRPVEMQGSLSYTVIATTETVVSFRVPEAKLGNEYESLAKYIHGDLVPQSAYHGRLGDEKDDKRSLLIYTMPYLPGKSYLEVQPFGPELTDVALEKHVNYIRHLARRSWKAKAGYLTCSARGYPQVLSHMDLSETNVLVDEESFDISGVIDWSQASVQPFGFELWALRRMLGVMSGPGWHDYSSRGVSESAFWDEFWHATGINDDKQRNYIQRQSLLASKLGVVMDFAFSRTLDGRPLDVVMDKPARYLREWLGASWLQILPIRQPGVENARAGAREVSREAAEGQKTTTDLSPGIEAQVDPTADTIKDFLDASIHENLVEPEAISTRIAVFRAQGNTLCYYLSQQAAADLNNKDGTNGKSQTLWDHVEPSHLAACVSSHNHLVRYRNHTAVTRELEHVQDLFWAGKVGPHAALRPRPGQTLAAAADDAC
ncbi:hypothetical protein PG994_003567 [Apiospora phragmitis]|uniref:Aminoglycoside phosphotransferase domain-containing protein n=1 Tax=Apiospora phragmitis TaxID=2905665 RepID=A0ABR1W1K0_9PEZI